MQYEVKKRAEWERAKVLEGTELTLNLGLRDGASAGRVRPPSRQCTKKRKAARTLFPGMRAKKRDKKDEGQKKTVTKEDDKQTPVVKKTSTKKKIRAQRKEKDKMQAQETAKAQRNPHIDLTTPVAQQQSRLLQQQQHYKSVTMKKMMPPFCL